MIIGVDDRSDRVIDDDLEERKANEAWEGGRIYLARRWTNKSPHS